MNFLKFYSENTRLEARIFISLFSRPRRDRDFCKMIFRDRDETKTRNVTFLDFSRPRRDFFDAFYQVTPPFSCVEDPKHSFSVQKIFLSFDFLPPICGEKGLFLATFLIVEACVQENTTVVSY